MSGNVASFVPTIADHGKGSTLLREVCDAALQFRIATLPVIGTNAEIGQLAAEELWQNRANGMGIPHHHPRKLFTQ